MTITVKELEALSKQPGTWMSERVRHGHGALAFRALANGEIAVYFRYQDEGRRRQINLGRFGADGSRGKLTLADARAKAGDLARRHADETVALREVLESESRARNAALRAATQGTFDQLLMAYCAALKVEGKQSAGQAVALFDKWVRKEFPHLLLRKAGHITHNDIMEILKGAVRANMTRTVNKLRSYLLAAFNRAITANGDPSLAVEVGSAATLYGIGINPVAATKRVRKFEKKNVGNKLNEEDIRHIWTALEDIPLEIRNFVRLNFRLAGQRIAQLMRLKGSDIDLANGTLCLWDTKGRRDEPRKHTLPIPRQAVGLIEELLARHGNDYLFSKDGAKPLEPTSISNAMKEIRNNKTGSGIYARDLRTTAESRLSEMNIDPEIRGRLLSHGLTGLQYSHYDKGEYLPQLHQVLHQWNEWLDQLLAGESYKRGNVFPFKRMGGE